MSSVDAAHHSRRRVLPGLLILVALGAVCGLTICLTPRTVRVGRLWPIADRVGYGDISHRTWDELLHRYVDKEGRVDYAGWKSSATDLRKLDDYLNRLSQLDEQRTASKGQLLEFWVNAYNALTIRGLLREYPTSSIQNHVSRLWGFNIWRDLQIMVGDKSYSLGQIEHSILRPLKEPRVHFAIVCGSTGCPRLLNEAYSIGKLEEQLKENTLAFFADTSKCAFDPERNELRLSPILKWYADDFGSSDSTVVPKISDWLPADLSPEIKAGNVKVLFGDYDWSLNEQRGDVPPLPSP